MTISALPPPSDRRHKWGDPITVPCEISLSAHEETHRHCELCPVVKITVHDGRETHRMWRAADGARVFGAEPPCSDVVLVTRQEQPLIKSRGP